MLLPTLVMILIVLALVLAVLSLGAWPWSGRLLSAAVVLLALAALIGQVSTRIVL